MGGCKQRPSLESDMPFNFQPLTPESAYSAFNLNPCFSELALLHSGVVTKHIATYHTMLKVRRWKLDPTNLKAPGFQRFNPNEDNLAFNLNLISELCTPFTLGQKINSKRSNPNVTTRIFL